MRIAFIFLLLLAPGLARAQAEDGRLTAMRQLLTEANDRVVNLAAQLKDAKDEIERIKKAAVPSKEETAK